MDTLIKLESAILDTELRHTHFFNGRLLSAEDLLAEREATHAHLRQLGQAAGCGVVYGLEVTRAPDTVPSDGVVEIKKGLAVNISGRTLHLESDIKVALIPPPDPASRADCVFSDCEQLPSTPGLSGDGYFVLTLAPAAQREGLAPISGLGNSPAACNSRYLTEAVQFRLVQLNVNPGSNAAQRRNVVAYQCFGLPPLGPSDFVRAALAPAAAPVYGLAALTTAGHLTEHDVPLAVIEWRATTGLGDVDLWPARRRVTRFDAGKVLGHFTDDRRCSEAEAALLQFQDQAAAILLEPGVAPNLKAESRFRFLPPAGFLKTDATGFDWKKFLGAHAPASETPLHDGLVRSVVRHSLGQEPVLVVAATDAATLSPVPFHVYRVPSRPDYVLFARSSLGEVLAEDVRFDNSHCKLPGVETVQDAIEALCDACHGCCTLVVHPEPGWEKIFDRIAPGQDAEVCFCAGTFSLSKPLVIQGKGHLRIVGCGRATRILCSGGETALHFQDCASVRVGHVRAESGALARGKPQGPNLSGALNFVGCPEVEVEHAILVCPGGATRMAACLAVRNEVDAPGEVRVHHCQVEVGREQTGILLINTLRAQVEDNVLRAKGGVAWNSLVENLGFRGRLRPLLVARSGSAPSTSVNASVTRGSHTVTFRTPAALANVWQPAVTAVGGTPTLQGLEQALTLVTDRILLGKAVPGVSATLLNDLFGTVAERAAAAGSQGIVVGGRVATDVRLVHNTVTDFVQGIHVGLSHEDELRLQPDQAGTVLILENTIRVRLTAGATRSRHGIFAGNCASLVIERNHVTLARAKAAASLPIEGIRVFGLFGRRMLVRENHLAPAGDSTAFDTGIRFHALNAPDKAGTRMWIIGENVFESSPRRFDILPKQQQILRGLDTNIA